MFADFPRARRHRRALEVPIRPGAPLRREWSIVSDAPSSAAVMAGWERADGRFEVVWTVEADAVRTATEVGRRLAVDHAPRLSLPDSPPPLAGPDPTATIRRATALTNRVVAYLD